jgi:hypothetical protein
MDIAGLSKLTKETIVMVLSVLSFMVRSHPDQINIRLNFL